MNIKANAAPNTPTVAFLPESAVLQWYPLQQHTHVFTLLYNFHEQPLTVHRPGAATPRVAIAFGELLVLIFCKNVQTCLVIQSHEHH